MWAASTDRGNNSYILGWDLSGQAKHNYSMGALLQISDIRFTSNIMVGTNNESRVVMHY